MDAETKVQLTTPDGETTRRTFCKMLLAACFLGATATLESACDKVNFKTYEQIYKEKKEAHEAEGHEPVSFCGEKIHCFDLINYPTLSSSIGLEATDENYPLPEKISGYEFEWHPASFGLTSVEVDNDRVELAGPIAISPEGYHSFLVKLPNDWSPQRDSFRLIAHYDKSNSSEHKALEYMIRVYEEDLDRIKDQKSADELVTRLSDREIKKLRDEGKTDDISAWEKLNWIADADSILEVMHRLGNCLALEQTLLSDRESIAISQQEWTDLTILKRGKSFCTGWAVAAKSALELYFEKKGLVPPPIQLVYTKTKGDPHAQLQIQDDEGYWHIFDPHYTSHPWTNALVRIESVPNGNLVWFKKRHPDIKPKFIGDTGTVSFSEARPVKSQSALSVDVPVEPIDDRRADSYAIIPDDY